MLVKPFLGRGFVAVLTSPGILQSQNPVHVAPNAPPDRPRAMDSCIYAAAAKAIAPLVAQAKTSYPAARARFLRGLPGRHSFFIVTELQDSLGNREQVFIAVDSIAPDSRGVDRVTGRIWNQTRLVRGYALYQPHSFRETDLIDWLITRPDGTEEGNLVGNFLDRWRPPAECLR